MNRDDDSFLSSYLDGELDPHERSLVESALVSEPELAEKLRSLTALRDLLSGLNRDCPVDVANRVMGRIHVKRVIAARGLRRSTWQGMVKISSRTAMIAGIAATLLLAISVTGLLLIRWTRPGQHGPLAERGSAPQGRLGAVPGYNLHEVPSGQPSPARGAIAAASDRAASSGSRDVGGKAPGRVSHGPKVLAKSGTLEHYRQLLDTPHERRLFRISDAGDGKALKQVANVVESATQFGFYKVTIAQGIVIDPRHPGEATVFAALVGARGLDAMRDRLARAVPDGAEEWQIDPAVLAQLADIGQVRAFRSAPFGDVLIPREILAFQRKPGETEEELTVPDEGGDAASPGQPTIEQERSAPIGELVAQGLTARAGAAPESAEAPEPPAGGATARPGRGAPAESLPRDSVVGAPPAVGPASRRRGAPERTFVVLVWVERSRRG
jgi:hypothetical protein